MFTAANFNLSGSHATTPVTWDHNYNVNVRGPFNMDASQAATITYDVAACGNYQLSDLYNVSVDPNPNCQVD